jgi:transcriptional regulator
LAEQKTDLLKGTLDLLILKTLSLEPKHGLGISRRIEQITRGTFQVKPGSLFPALHRLEQEGWIEEAPGQPGKHSRAKYYQLTRTGRKQLRAATDNWERITGAVGRVLQTSS